MDRNLASGILFYKEKKEGKREEEKEWVYLILSAPSW
jgi:hypothetical protein